MMILLMNDSTHIHTHIHSHPGREIPLSIHLRALFVTCDAVSFYVALARQFYVAGKQDLHVCAMCVLGCAQEFCSHCVSVALIMK